MSPADVDEPFSFRPATGLVPCVKLIAPLFYPDENLC